MILTPFTVSAFAIMSSIPPLASLDLRDSFSFWSFLISSFKRRDFLIISPLLVLRAFAVSSITFSFSYKTFIRFSPVTASILLTPAAIPLSDSILPAVSRQMKTEMSPASGMYQRQI